MHAVSRPRSGLFLGLWLSMVTAALIAAPAAHAGDISTAPPGARTASTDNTLRFWYALPVRDAAQFDAMVRSYQQSHPTVRLETRNFPSPEALRDALMGPAEALPHLALIDTRWQSRLIKAHRLLPAEDQMTRIGAMVKVMFKADTFPAMWAAVQQDGKVWTLPAFGTLHALLYDADMLKRAGVKAAPKNWWEIVIASKKVHQENPEMWGFQVPTDQEPREIGRLFEVAGWECGGKSDADDPTTLSFGVPEYEAALQFWQDLVYKYKVAPQAPVERAKTAMYFGTIADLLDAQAQGRHLEAAPCPAGKKARAADLSMYSVALMNVQPERADRNFELASWIVDFQQSLIWSMQAAYLPANKQVTLSPGYYQYLEAHRGLRAFLAELALARMGPTVAHHEEALVVLGQALKNAMDKHVSPHDALSDADKQVHAALQAATSGAPVSKP